jgi:MFS family permease
MDTPASTKQERIDPRRVVAFMAMCFGMFMALLDIQIVSASLNQIQAGLAASADEIPWVQTAYLIAEVVAIRGRRRGRSMATLLDHLVTGGLRSGSHDRRGVASPLRCGLLCTR